MSTVMDLLTKAGYEAASIGDDVFPCTLRKEGEPIGFLMGDLSIRLLSDMEQERRHIESVMSFAVENQGLEMVQDEYKLSQYRDVVLTAMYDFDEFRPVYNIYSLQNDGSFVLLNSVNDQSLAAKDFASRSGLVQGDIPEPVRNYDRVKEFVEKIQSMGYQLKENREEANRAYDISDKDGNTVGFIGKDNRVTITSEDVKTKRTLTNAYVDSNPNKAVLPSFFEKLKNSLRSIGMALKVVFTSSGRHYAIHNQQQREIATVSEQGHEITYTDQATKDEMEKINSLVEEIHRESREKEVPEAEKSVVSEEKVEDVSLEPNHTASEYTREDVQNFADSILSNPEMANAFLSVVLSNESFVSRFTSEITKLQKTAQETELPEKAHEVQKDYVMNPAEEKAKQDFERYYQELQTYTGFNEDKYQEVQKNMVAIFGTDDPEIFIASLQQGKFREIGSLKEKIRTSQRVADLQNAVKTAEPARAQEKEMA